LDFGLSLEVPVTGKLTVEAVLSEEETRLPSSSWILSNTAVTLAIWSLLDTILFVVSFVLFTELGKRKATAVAQ